MTTATVSVRGLEKTFGDHPVLRGVDLELAPGDIVALLGTNGAGKTTLVRILATLLAADAGVATVVGADVSERPADVRASISLAGQFSAVDDVLTARENLVLVGRLRHQPDPRGLADRLLGRFGLADVADRRAAALSGGMRRRLDLAMSLVGNPPVVLLDEPTTGLDPESRLEVWQAVRELAEGGTTVLLTTQHLEEAEQLAHRIAVLHDGRILVDGTLAELRALLPPARVEYVRREPTLEDVFLALVAGSATTGRTPR